MGPECTLCYTLLPICFPEGPTNSRTVVAEGKDKLQAELWEGTGKNLNGFATGETITQNQAPRYLSTLGDLSLASLSCIVTIFPAL